MLIKQEIIGKIRNYFNLNIYETKVWLALLGKGTASAGEIATISGVPRSRTYDVLESLEKKGFAVVKIGKPIKYLGIKPRMVLERMKNEIRAQADEKISILSKIKEADEFMQLEDLYKTGIDPIKNEELSIALKGRENIINYLREVFEDVKKEVLICTNTEDILIKHKFFTKIFEILKQRDIKIKLALYGDYKLIEQIENKFMIKAKKSNLDSKFFIIDRKEMLFYLSKNPNLDEVAICINSEFFVKAFVSLFENTINKV